MTIEAIIFDLDGLMVDSEPLARAAWAELLSRYGHKLDDETISDILGLRLRDTSQLIRDRFDLPLTVKGVAQERSEIFLASLAGNLQPMPGLIELLDEIDARDIPRAVATSSPSFYAPIALEEIGVADGFTAIITGDTIAGGKPAPDIYLSAAAALGKSPPVCLALEDSINGVRAAKAAGMRCIVIPNGLSADMDLSAADVTLASLKVLAERLDEFLR